MLRARRHPVEPDRLLVRERCDEQLRGPHHHSRIGRIPVRHRRRVSGQRSGRTHSVSVEVGSVEQPVRAGGAGAAILAALRVPAARFGAVEGAVQPLGKTLPRARRRGGVNSWYVSACRSIVHSSGGRTPPSSPSSQSARGVRVRITACAAVVLGEQLACPGLPEQPQAVVLLSRRTCDRAAAIAGRLIKRADP